MKVPIRIQPMFWVFAGLIGFLSTRSLVGTLVWIVVILVSVLVHELGHALTGLAFKQRVFIQLQFFGGATYRDGPKLSLPKEFLLTLNGPLFGLVLGGVTYGILYVWTQPPPIAQLALFAFIWVNFFWSLVNLLPVMPLDGGHLLRIICEGIFGARGTSISLLISVVLGAALAVTAFIIGYFLVGAIFFILTFESYRTWQSLRHMAEPDRDESMQERYRSAAQAAQQGQTEEALRGFEEIRLATGMGLLFVAASEGAARIYANRGEVEKAFDYLESIRKHLSPDSLPLFHSLAYKTGHFDLAVRVGKECYQLSPTYEVAFVNALAHAALRDVGPTIGWLKCAIREGMPNLPSAVSGKEFDPVRQDPSFEDFVKGMGG